MGSAVELMKHATSMLDVLTLGSMEDQGIYVYTWSKMISVCAQELKHGSWIWKQLVEKNIQSKILSEPRGTASVAPVWIARHSWLGFRMEIILS